MHVVAVCTSTEKILARHGHAPKATTSSVRQGQYPAPTIRRIDQAKGDNIVTVPAAIGADKLTNGLVASQARVWFRLVKSSENTDSKGTELL